MLSKRAKYALKALLALAEHPREEPVRIADLARDEHIPPKFLELILLVFKHHGMLQSRKGKGGTASGSARTPTATAAQTSSRFLPTSSAFRRAWRSPTA